jgi:catechol 2,3-dioxygenase-like lactoylglutathione lyase family enzyme
MGAATVSASAEQGEQTVTVVHHSAIRVHDVEASLRFWRDGLGFEVLMDEWFTGDWPTLLRSPSTSLRAVFLGDTAAPGSGIVELVDLGPAADVAKADDANSGEAPSAGFLLLSVMTDLVGALGRLAALGLGGVPRRIEVSGVAMAVVRDPNGVLVELVDSGASANLERLTRRGDG